MAQGRVALWTILGAKLVAAWGLQWDIQWHVLIGRDSFWIAPHLMTYTGVTLTVLPIVGVLLRDTLRHGAAPLAPPRLRVLGIVGTRGVHLAAWGIALTVLAAPIDDLWHRVVGLDATLWSPPHLLGLAGAGINTLGCLVIAREVYPAASRSRLMATLIATAMLHESLRVVASPAFHLAYVHGGVAFHAFAILGALLFPPGLIAAARLTGLREAPLVVASLALLIGLGGERVAQVGFEVLQPVSGIEEEIARHPASPIAVTNLIAHLTGERPGSLSVVPVLASMIAVLVLAGLDPRRRPLAASLGHAITLFAVFAVLLATSPAFGPLAAGPGATLVALMLALAAAVAGAAAGQGLTRAIQRGEPAAAMEPRGSRGEPAVHASH